MAPGDTFEDRGRRLEMVEVRHIVPAVGYIVDNGRGTFAFSGDTSTNDSFWQVLNTRNSLDMLLVECAFANKDKDLSRRAGHYCPETLAKDLTKLAHQADIFISHNKPGEEELIFQECRQAIQSHTLQRLTSGHHFTL